MDPADKPRDLDFETNCQQPLVLFHKGYDRLVLSRFRSNGAGLYLFKRYTPTYHIPCETLLVNGFRRRAT
jgi:hypothetical protein